MPFFDIAIIGAGPAGSAAAILLARRGYAVALLDRAEFPRDKVCGDYLTPGAIALLRDELDILPALLAAGASRVEHETIVAHDGRSFSASVDALSCPRMVTDAVLLDAARRAGATIFEGFAVRDILFDGSRVTGVTGVSRNGKPVKIRANVTVGADGTHSLLARRLGVVREIPRLHRLALSAYVAGSDPGLAMYLPRDLSLACCGFGSALPLSPSPSPLQGKGSRKEGDPVRNVNIVVPVSEAKRIAGGRKAYFRDRLARSFPEAWERLRDSEIVGPVRATACFGHRTTRAAHDGALLVGDAAMFVHPFTGEGVYYALEGARLAAEAIDEALRCGDTSYKALSGYDHARRKTLLPRYRLCDAAQHIVHSPRLLGWLVPRLAASPDLTRAVFRAVGDIDTPRQLLTGVNLARLCTPKT